MKVKIFKNWMASEQQDEINQWFSENNVVVHNITQSTGGESTQWTIISIFYTEVNGLEFEKVK
jgi:hypothetical protein